MPSDRGEKGSAPLGMQKGAEEFQRKETFEVQQWSLTGSPSLWGCMSTHSHTQAHKEANKHTLCCPITSFMLSLFGFKGTPVEFSWPHRQLCLHYPIIAFVFNTLGLKTCYMHSVACKVSLKSPLATLVLGEFPPLTVNQNNNMTLPPEVNGPCCLGVHAYIYREREHK